MYIQLYYYLVVKKKIINECHKNVRCVVVGAKRAISSLFNLSLMEKNQFDFLSFIKNRGLLFASKLIKDISKKQLAQGYWSIAWFHFIHGFISRFPLLINIYPFVIALFQWHEFAYSCLAIKQNNYNLDSQQH